MCLCGKINLNCTNDIFIRAHDTNKWDELSWGKCLSEKLVRFMEIEIRLLEGCLEGFKQPSTHRKVGNTAEYIIVTVMKLTSFPWDDNLSSS